MDIFTTSITGKVEAALGFTTATQACMAGAGGTAGMALVKGVTTAGEAGGWSGVRYG